MTGHNYSDEGLERYFGVPPSGVFLYMKAQWEDDKPGDKKNAKSSFEAVPEGRHCLYLRFAEDALEWHLLRDPRSLAEGANPQAAQQADKHDTGAPEADFERPVDPVPLFKLDLSGSLAAEYDLVAELASVLYAGVFEEAPHSILTAETVGYSNLNVWDLDGGRKTNWLHLSTWSNASRSTSASHFREARPLTRGRLFLDFLFDLEHTRVFLACPHILDVKQRLMAHPLVNAIRAKARYYWCRQRVIDEPPWRSAAVGRVGAEALRALGEAEVEWITACFREGASALFASGRNWFTDSEEEVRRALFWDGLQQASQGSKAAGLYLDFLRSRALACDRLSDPAKQKDVRSSADLLREGNRWFLRRYDLDSAALCLLPRGKNAQAVARQLSLACAMLPSIVIAALCSAFFPPSVPQNLLVLCTLILVLLVARLAPRVVFPRICRISVHRQPLPLRLVWPHLILTVCGVGACYLLAFFGVPHGASRAPATLASGVSIFFILASFLLVPAAVLRHALLRLLLPRLCVAIAASWLLVAGSEEFVKSSVLIGWREILLGGGLFILTAFTASVVIYMRTSAHLQPPRDWWRPYLRGLGLAGVAFITAIIIGIPAIHFVAKPILLDSRYLEGATFAVKAVDFGSDYSEVEPRVFTLGTNRFELISSGVYRCGGDLYPTAEIRFLELESLSWGRSARTERAEGNHLLYEFSPPPPFCFMGPISIMPAFLLYRSFFVVFLAMFLQLLFEDRHATEPV